MVDGQRIHRVVGLASDDTTRTQAEVLNRMGNLPGLADQATYRNANGAYMKLMNFRRFDPEYAEVGKVWPLRSVITDE